MIYTDFVIFSSLYNLHNIYYLCIHDMCSLYGLCSLCEMCFFFALDDLNKLYSVYVLSIPYNTWSIYDWNRFCFERLCDMCKLYDPSNLK